MKKHDCIVQCIGTVDDHQDPKGHPPRPPRGHPAGDRLRGTAVYLSIYLSAEQIFKDTLSVLLEQGSNLFYNGRLIFHILDVENEPRIKLPCPHTWNNIKKIFFNIPWRKLGKNVNIFHLNMNFF